MMQREKKPPLQTTVLIASSMDMLHGSIMKKYLAGHQNTKPSGGRATASSFVSCVSMIQKYPCSPSTSRMVNMAIWKTGIILKPATEIPKLKSGSSQSTISKRSGQILTAGKTNTLARPYGPRKTNYGYPG